jgi:hypothetical protein
MTMPLPLPVVIQQTPMEHVSLKHARSHLSLSLRELYGQRLKLHR